jgi:hypothetical protein
MMPLRKTQTIEPIDEDPIPALNRAHAGLSPNAADEYRRALAVYAAPLNQNQNVLPSLADVSHGTLPAWAAD